MAAAMGALPSADFGRTLPSQVRRAPMARRPQSAQFGDMGFGGSDYGFGFGFGQDASPAAAATTPPPPPGGHPHGGHGAPNGHGMHPAVHHAMKTAHHTDTRALALDPNKYSTVKVQGYSFSLSQALVLGTALAFNVTLQPNAKIHPKRMFANVNTPGFVTLSSVLVANVNVLIGGTDDAYTYSPLSQGTVNEFPTLDTSTRATMIGNYTGFVPPGYASAASYTFVLTLQGPSTLAGNG
jgi:hypothetical protein